MYQPRLSPREREVLQLTADGWTGREIAAELFLSIHTVNHYRESARLKLGARNGVHTVVIALRLGLIRF